MSVITTGTHPKHLWPGVYAFWGMSYKDRPEQWRDLVEATTSDKNFEEMVNDSGFGLAAIKTQGAGIAYDTTGQGPTTRFTHVVYGLGYIVTREEMEDNQYEKLSMDRAKSLKRGMMETKEYVVANIYNRAFSSSYLGADGVSLLSASHPTRSANQSNLLATAADLSEASLEDMIIQIMDTQDDRGIRKAIMPQSLIVTRQNWFNANRILKSTLQNDTANNAINVLKSTNALPGGVKVNLYLSDNDAWFIRTDCEKSLTLFQRRPLEMTQDNDFDTENMKAKNTERYSVGWADWRGLFGTAGS